MLGFTQVIEDLREVVRRPPGRYEAIPDDMTAQEIAEQADVAAKGNTLNCSMSPMNWVIYPILTKWLRIR